jgi:hypothetical protein
VPYGVQDTVNSSVEMGEITKMIKNVGQSKSITNELHSIVYGSLNRETNIFPTEERYPCSVVADLMKKAGE